MSTFQDILYLLVYFASYLLWSEASRDSDDDSSEPVPVPVEGDDTDYDGTEY